MFWRSKKEKEEVKKDEVKRCKEEKDEKVEEEQIETGFAQTYGVELLYEGLPKIPKDELLNSIRKKCGDVDFLTSNDDLISFVFKEHLIEYKDGRMPAQCAIMKANKLPDYGALESALQQSWKWREAQSEIEKCKYTYMITDFLASALEYPTRLELFQKVLTSFIELAPCNAIHWRPSQQIINPASYLLSQKAGENFNPLYGAVNVRLFNISDGGEGDTLMDTMGLAALGIPDLQCHFRGLDVNDIAGILYTYSGYVYENGDIIDDGNTIQGITPEEKWKCQHEISLVKPERIVLDINPGKPYAAGNR